MPSHAPGRSMDHVLSNAPDRGRRLPPRKSGRPTRRTAEKLRDHILDVATDLFMQQGYGLTTVEAVAQEARVSKRTLYFRFEDKAALFSAVVNRIIDRLHPPADVPLIDDGTLDSNLTRLAHLMLQGALSAEGLALSRLIAAESAKFPELAAIAAEKGGRQEAIELVSSLLVRHRRTERITIGNPEFAAQQFLQMVITIPQRRALGLGEPMTDGDLQRWVRDTVDLFLNGCRGGSQ